MIIKAFAKINPILDVVSRREDGYHIIDSCFQSVSLFDTVKIEKDNEISVVCSKESICGKENIAYKSAEKFFEFTKVSGGAKIEIEKNIPLAAGLGGGSADAAAVIAGLNKLYHTNLSEDELLKIGLSVGADVPFCITGGTARVGGIGEKIKKLKDFPNCYFVIIKEGTKLSTKDMYEKIDSQNPPHPKTDKMEEAITVGDLNKITKYIGNSFEAVCSIENTKKLFWGTVFKGISLSGSGPAVFAVYEKADNAKRAYEKLKSLGKDVYLATPVTCGIKFE